ncbi:MAG: exo-alpha-sialidase, partial [Planctomycetes bacterium]|nr:exo-alpha-sialidase [Planctomycetota bacterium]
WQKPMRDLSGGYFVGYSHWLKPAAAYLKEVKDWTEIESVVEFMRFTNIDADPQPRDLAVRYSAPDKALRAPHRTYPHMSVLQEPSIVRLPDRRLFCVMRSCSGTIWWSQSRDDGETWCSARPLLYRDHGRPLLNPVSPDPIYPLSDGRYIILYHNNPGGTGAGGHNDATPREPLFLSVGEYRPAADQPVWFSEPRLLMATEGYDIDGVRRPSTDARAGYLPMYSSLTNRKGSDVLWYPDSKHWLLGKRITPELLAGLHAPQP